MIMAAADVLVPNRHQDISNHQDDFTYLRKVGNLLYFVVIYRLFFLIGITLHDAMTGRCMS